MLNEREVLSLAADDPRQGGESLFVGEAFPSGADRSGSRRSTTKVAAPMLDIDENSLKQGVLGLVIALVEIIKDALKTQAFERMEAGSLGEEEINRLGEALMDLDVALDQIKEEHGWPRPSRAARRPGDSVDEVLEKMVNPERWREELEAEDSQG